MMIFYETREATSFCCGPKERAQHNCLTSLILPKGRVSEVKQLCCALFLLKNFRKYSKS